MCEETKPHPHKDVIIAWANGAKIEYSTNGANWYELESPSFNKEVFYRVKPKPKVKKWRWVGVGLRDLLFITEKHYSSFEEYKEEYRYTSAFVQKIDSTMIEVEE